MNLSIPQKRSRTMINFIHNTVYKLKFVLMSGCIHRLIRLVSGYICYLLPMFAMLWKMFLGSNDNCSEGSFKYRCLAHLNTGIPFCCTDAECVPVVCKTVKYKIGLFIFHQLFSKESSTEIFPTGGSPPRVSSFYRHNLF